MTDKKYTAGLLRMRDELREQGYENKADEFFLKRDLLGAVALVDSIISSADINKILLTMSPNEYDHLKHEVAPMLIVYEQKWTPEDIEAGEANSPAEATEETILLPDYLDSMDDIRTVEDKIVAVFEEDILSGNHIEPSQSPTITAPESFFFSSTDNEPDLETGEITSRSFCFANVDPETIKAASERIMAIQTCGEDPKADSRKEAFDAFFKALHALEEQAQDASGPGM